MNIRSYLKLKKTLISLLNKTRSGYYEEKIPGIVFSLLIGLSIYAVIGSIFNLKLAGFLNTIQFSVPILSGLCLLVKKEPLSKGEKLFCLALLLLGASDACYYLISEYLKWFSDHPIIELAQIIPYLLFYTLAGYALWINIGVKAKIYPIGYIGLCLLVPLLLATPTFYESLKAVKNINLYLIIVQCVIVYSLMTISLFSLIVSQDLFWNTVALGLFCMGLTDLSITIEHFLHTVTIESINTYLWTFSSLTFNLPFLLSNTRPNPELFSPNSKSLVLKARIWLVAGITVPVTLFGFIGKSYNIISFTSLTVLLTTSIVYVITNEFLQRLQFLSEIMRDLSTTDVSEKKLELVPFELKNGMLNLFIEKMRHKKLELEAEQKRRDDVARISSQVAHDIRSPLSALNLITSTLQDVPEEKRLIIRNAVVRINDIANNLLQRAKNQNQANQSLSKIKEAKRTSMLSSLVDAMTSEKRIQYRERIDIEIETDLSKSYGLFSSIDTADLSRAISNIIDNSVESFEDRGGKVKISVQNGENTNDIVISDNGKGIDQDILVKLGQVPVSHGKENSDSGSGLGFLQIKQAITNSGGSVTIRSQLKEGTTVILSLQKATPPKWFTHELEILENSTLVSVDDDQTISQIWSGRINSLLEAHQQINHLTFSSMALFEQWYLSTPQAPTTQYLIDYEFIRQTGNGLELIERLNICHQAFLVSSRVEEPAIQVKALSIGVKMIPKSLASLIPIKVKSI